MPNALPLESSAVSRRGRGYLVGRGVGYVGRMTTTTRKRLRIPAQLRAVLVGSAATFACSTSPSTNPQGDSGPLADTSAPSDGGRDELSPPADSGQDVIADVSVASFDGGPCKIKVPAGKVCETTCVNARAATPMPYACQIYCSRPTSGGPGACSCGDGGAVPMTGVCPGGLEQDCELTALPDGGTEVLC
jgi:hypothetical protein